MKKQPNKTNSQYQAEKELICVDWLGVTAKLNGFSYSSAPVDKIFKEYFEDGGKSDEEYVTLLGKLEATRNTILSKMLKEQKLSVLNPTSYFRKEYIKLGDEWYVASVEGYETTTLQKLELEESKLTCSDDQMSNGLVTITFDESGCISGIKMEDKSVSSFAHARFVKQGFGGKQKLVEAKLVSSQCYIDGARVVKENIFNYGRNSYVEQIVLYEEDRNIYVTTRVVIGDKRRGVRVFFDSQQEWQTISSDWLFSHQNVVVGKDKEQDFAVILHQPSENFGDGQMGVQMMGKGKYECDYTLSLLVAEWQDSNIAELSENQISPLIVSEFLPKIRRVVSVDNNSVLVRRVKLDKDETYVKITLQEMYNQPCSTKILVGFRSKGAYLVKGSDVEKIDDANISFEPLEVKEIIFEL